MVVSIDDLRNGFKSLAKSKGKEAAMGILKKFDATRVPEIPEDKYGAVLAEINKAAS